MLGLLRAWAGVANTGQELGKKIPQGTLEVAQNGEEPPGLFHLVL